MNDIIVFENAKPPFSQISTLESVFEKMPSRWPFLPAKGPVIVGGDHLIFGRTKSWLRTQKGRSLKTLEGFIGGTTQICLENEDMGEGGGGDRESQGVAHA